jgi:hypothetical protein
MQTALRLALALVSFVLAAEVGLAVLAPTPRVQAIRADQVVAFDVVDGIPFWAAPDPEVSHVCADDPRPRAVFVGSSILRGAGLADAGDVFSARLQPLAPDWCIDNVAEPAFTGPQKSVAALRAIAVDPPPARLYWEVWDNDPARWWVTEGVAWNLLHHPDAPGWGPVRGRLAEVLFHHSALWRNAVLAWGSTPGGDAAAFAAGLDRDLAPVLDAAERRGVEVVLVVASPLDRPFSESVVRPNPMLAGLWPFATAHGLRWIRLALAFEAEDVEALRLDPCCHFNREGHARLAERFAEDLQRGRR